MEKKNSDQMKEYLLVGFVLVSVVLIASLWANSVLDRESQTPGYYRPTMQVDDGYFTTQTAAVDLGTLPPAKQHKNEHGTPQPELLAPSTPSPTYEVDQEN